MIEARTELAPDDVDLLAPDRRRHVELDIARDAVASVSFSGRIVKNVLKMGPCRAAREPERAVSQRRRSPYSFTRYRTSRRNFARPGSHGSRWNATWMSCARMTSISSGTARSV